MGPTPCDSRLIEQRLRGTFRLRSGRSGSRRLALRRTKTRLQVRSLPTKAHQHEEELDA
jgi:hypothetical protein